MDKKVDKLQNNIFLLISVLLFAFCVLKVLRGSDTDSTAAGGIWNYISLLYYPLAFFALFQTEHTVRAVFVAPTLYVLIAVFSSVLNFSGTLDKNSAYNFLMIPYFLLVFITFYCFSGDNKKGQYIILLAFFICLAINLTTILKYQFGAAERPLASDIYFSLCLLPFVLMISKNKKIKMLAIIGMFFAVFFSNKRTGLIAFVLAFIVYKLIDEYINNPQNIVRLIKSIVLTAIILLAFYYVGSYFDNKYDFRIFARLENLTEDGGSGRIEIYSAIWREYKNSFFLDKLIGQGLFATNSLTGFNAHNDFLEVLYDYGIFAFVCIVCFYFSLINQAIVMFRRRSPYAAAFAASIVIGLFLSLFSYLLAFFTYTAGIAAFWGYCLSMEKERICMSENLT